MNGDILICIPTCMRPKMLTSCLASVAKTNPPPNNPVRLLVLDNDKNKTAEPVFAAAAQFPFPARYAVEPTRGLCAVRNRALDEAKAAGAGFLAFIDDDHEVGENWLRALLGGMEESGADAVSGRVQYIYPAGGLPHWMPAEKTPAPGLQTVTTIETAFALLKARVFEDLRFDMRFNFVGAEDYDFSLRAKRRGFLFAATSEARATSALSAARMTFRSYFATQWQRQTGYVLSHRLVDGFWNSLRFFPKGIVKLCKGAVYCAAGLLLGKKILAKGTKNIIAGSGLTYGVFAHGNYQKYAKIEGE